MSYLPITDILRAYFQFEEGDREYVIKKKIAEKAGQLDEKLTEILPPLHEILSLKVEDEGYINLDLQKKRETEKALSEGQIYKRKIHWLEHSAMSNTSHGFFEDIFCVAVSFYF